MTTDRLDFVVTVKRVEIDGAIYLETTEGWTGQPARWTRYGPIPANLVAQMKQDLLDLPGRVFAAALVGTEVGIIMPAPKPKPVYGKPIYDEKAYKFSIGQKVYVAGGYDAKNPGIAGEQLDGMPGRITGGPHGEAYDISIPLPKYGAIAVRIDAKWLIPAPPDPPADPPGYTIK